MSVENTEWRECTVCGDKMGEGWTIENGLAYYCSKECMEKEMTWEHFMDLYADGEGDSYYTEWWDEIAEEEKEIRESEDLREVVIKW